jgi:flavin-binding protein dodecin
MSVIKVVELMSESEESWEDAAREVVERAAQTLRNIRSVYVKEFEAVVEDGEIARFRVNCKVTFALESGDDVGEDQQSGSGKKRAGAAKGRR